MALIIRKAKAEDIDAIANIYAKIHSIEEQGLVTIGWQRGVYPEKETAQAALKRDDLFVAEQDGQIVASAILNQQQVDVYDKGNWQYKVPADKVMVMHTLVVDPDLQKSGLGKAFVAFYEKYALEQGCPYLRMDTNAKNTNARNLYKKLGYSEIGIVPCVFNGINGVDLVLLEKKVAK